MIDAKHYAEADTWVLSDFDDVISIQNAKVHGIDSSIREAKFPMSVDTDTANSILTPGIRSLAEAEPGRGHDHWINGVNVHFELTFTNKAWVEAERYHWLDFVSSQSTMHRITKFDLDKAYIEFVDKRVVEVMKELVRDYNDYISNENYDKQVAAHKYLEILYTNPAGFKLSAGMTTNYLQLKTIYAQRKNHRLPEWRAFCRWIEMLPYSELITGQRD